MKHNAHDKVLKVEDVDEGLDFFYKNKTHALKMIDFIASVLPVKQKNSKQLISHDQNNNTFNYKYVYLLEIPKICKDDLVIIPERLRQQLGGVCPVLLCYKVSTVIHLLDPLNMKVVELS